MRSIILIINSEMGNAVGTGCFAPPHTAENSSSPSLEVKVILWEGGKRCVRGGKSGHVAAGEIMMEFPDSVMCDSDSFFMGHRVPVLSVHDHLVPGHTYFLLPIDRLPCNDVVSPSWLAALATSSSMSFTLSNSPFEYLKESNGRVLIKVVPDFITSLILNNNANNSNSNNENEKENNNGLFLCSTPELKKHYEQLVRSKDQLWCPKLETISEYNVRFSLSPCRFIAFQWKQKEKHHHLHM